MYHFLRFSSNSRFFDLVKAYGDKFLSKPLLPKDADVAEYINLILFLRQKLNTALDAIELESKHSSNFLKL